MKRNPDPRGAGLIPATGWSRMRRRRRPCCTRRTPSWRWRVFTGLGQRAFNGYVLTGGLPGRCAATPIWPRTVQPRAPHGVQEAAHDKHSRPFCLIATLAYLDLRQAADDVRSAPVPRRPAMLIPPTQSAKRRACAYYKSENA